MKLSRVAIALYVGLVFASGAVLGFFGNRLYTASTVSAKAAKNPPSPDEFRKMLIAEYQRRLQLNDDQVTKINAILDESLGRFNEARSKMRKELRAADEERVESIRAMLTPAQQAEYAKMRQERQQKQKNRQKQNGGGRTGGPGF